MTEEPPSKTRCSGWTATALKAGALMLSWLVLSGHYDLFHLLLGVGSVLLILAMNRRRESASAQMLTSTRWLQLLSYLPWLIKEMVLSALHVARVVLSPHMRLDPCLVRFRSEQPNEVAKVILGNSITLTPGTLTVDIDGEEFLVHALTRTLAGGLLDQTMQEKVASLFTDCPGRMVFDDYTDHGERTLQRNPERQQ